MGFHQAKKGWGQGTPEIGNSKCDEREQVGVAGAVGVGGVQDAGPVRTTDSGFSVSNIADIYADNTVTQGCHNRHLLPATLDTQACCRCLLPPFFIIYEIMSNFLRRSSTHLSWDHMLFQPSAHGSLPCVLPEGCRRLCRATAGAHRPAYCPSTVQWPARGRHLFVLPLDTDRPPLSYRKQNRQKPYFP